MYIYQYISIADKNDKLNIATSRQAPAEALVASPKVIFLPLYPYDLNARMNPAIPSPQVQPAPIYNKTIVITS